MYHKLEMELEVVAFTLTNMDFFFFSCSDEDGNPTQPGKGTKKEPGRRQAGSKRKIADEVAANEVAANEVDPPHPEETPKPGGGNRAGMCVLNIDH